MTDSHKILATLAAAGCIGVIGFMLMKQRTPSTTMQNDTAVATSVETAAATTETSLSQIKSKSELDALLAKTDKPVVIKISTTWCPPCQALKPIYKRVATDRADRAYFAEIDFDAFNDQDYLNTFDVKSFPTIIIFKQGKESSRAIGGRTKQALIQEFEKAGA